MKRSRDFWRLGCAAVALIGSTVVHAQTTQTGAITLDTAGGTETKPVTNANTIADPSTITTATPASTVSVTGGGIGALTGAANTYTGGTSVTGNSTLQVTTDAELGAATSEVTLGTSTTTTTMNPTNGSTTTTITTTSGGTLDLSQTTTAISSTRNILLNGPGTIVAGPGAAWTLGGAIAGTGSLTVTSGALNPGVTLPAAAITPTLILSGANTYTGGTNVTGTAILSVVSDANLGDVASGTLTLGNASTAANGATLPTLTLTNTAAVTSARSVVIDAGGAKIITGTAAWTLTSPIAGTGDLTIGGTNTLVLDGVNSSTTSYTGTATLLSGSEARLEIGDVDTPAASFGGSVLLNGGTLSGYGGVQGNVTNNGGTVIVGGGNGAVGVFSIAGNFTQGSGGTLQLPVSSTTSPILTVGGTATIAGNLSLIAGGLLKSETIPLITATTLNYNVANANVTQLSAAFSQVLEKEGNTLDLILSQRAALPENPSVFPAMTTVAIDDAQEANQTVLSRLTDARTSAAVENLRIAQDPHRTGNLSPYGAWFTGLGGFGSASGSGSTPGYDISGGGFMTGIDGQIKRGVLVGVAVGYTRNSVSEGGGASGTISTPRASAYASWWVGRVAFDGTLGVGYANMTGLRPISAIGASAASTFGGLQVTGAAQASSTFDVEGFQVTPAAGVKYALMSEHGFGESGAQGYDLNVASKTYNSLRPFIGATASTRYMIGERTAIEPTIRIAYEAETLGTSRQATVQVPYDAQNFTFDGLKSSVSRFTGNIGVVLETSRNLGFYTDVGVILAGNTTGTKVDAGVRYRF